MVLYLTEDELILVLVKALLKARELRSKVRPNSSARIHVAIQGVGKTTEPVVVHSDEEASSDLMKIAQLRASVAQKHSSNSKAMTSHAVGQLKGDRLAHSYAGGVPLYKSGVLVGSVGISGDSAEVDEAIAHAAAEDFAAPVSIRSDVVSGVSFHSGRSVEKFSIVGKSGLPPLLSSASVATLPPLPKISGPPSPGLPPLRSSAKLSSASLSTLPPLPSSPMGSVGRSTLPPLRTSTKLSGTSLSSLPPLPSSPMGSKMSGTTLPPLRSSAKLSGASLSTLPPLPTSPMTSKLSLPPLRSRI